MKTLEEIEARKMRQAQAQSPEDPPEEDPPEEPDELQQAQAEIDRLQQQMAALQGRLTPAQQQGDEFRRLYQESERERDREREELNAQIQELRESLDTPTNYEELLTEEEREFFDENQLRAIGKIADSIAKRRTPKIDVRQETLKVLEERNAQEVVSYRDSFLSSPDRGLGDLAVLANDPRFQKWIAQEENDDFDPLVNSFLAARSKSEVDRLGKALARRVSRYKAESSKGRKPDANTQSRTGNLQRRPVHQSNEELRKKTAEATRLARSRSPSDRAKAREILSSL